ncbi:MAG: heavy-metal-associated domain-containing protein [Deltaproteobacteria bacterium]|nr:heavy-metal-associated domain-containing protein [Deltaproteobacteria bacterium]
MSHYIHNVPGRLRVKIPSIKGKPQDGLKIQGCLDAMIGIDQVDFSHVTGSVLIHYDPNVIDASKILHQLEKKQYISKTKTSMDNPAAHLDFSSARSALGKFLFGWALGKALENTGLSFLAVLI